ncbi:hypothetical protein ACHQM5_013933 [Ranunculus cassubicifolius]
MALMAWRLNIVVEGSSGRVEKLVLISMRILFSALKSVGESQAILCHQFLSIAGIIVFGGLLAPAEAEAILEDIRPTPLKVVGYGVGFIAASYALSEWEKTLQLVGVIGLGQTIYQRIATYENSEDFKQDVRVLLSPFRVGTMAFSWAAGKLEPNRIGLPTSPSSSDVQSRVLQAAAKHESQPSDSEESSQEFPVATANENTDTFE